MQEDQAEEKIRRRLAAILAADMVGFSRLMEADEEGTIARLKAHRRDLIDPRIASHNGRIVKTTGDGMLVEFASVVDAVECAVAMQRDMAARERDQPDDRRIRFRIGINLGDIVIDGDDILGDGVNVAARLEALAEPGGICVSDIVYKSVRGKLDLGFESIGPQKVKNLSEPVSTYRVAVDPEPAAARKRRKAPFPARRAMAAVAVLLAAAVVVLVFALWRPWASAPTAPGADKTVLALPARPSVAVLPFTNKSAGTGQDYFADGITQDIIIGLSKVSGLFVIARNSAFAYKDKSANLRDVARQLGVRYVLTGSVRRAGDKLRIAAQLVDTMKGNNLWAESYDRNVSDVFAVQSEISHRVVRALSVTLKASEQERLFRAHTRSVPAYELFLQARRAHFVATEANFERAIGLYKRVIELDPDFAGGYAGLSFVYSTRTRLGLSREPKADIGRALALAKKAVAVDREFGWGYIALGGAQILLHQPDDAVVSVQRALDVQPNDADARLFFGWYATLAGKPDVGLANIRTAMRLDPVPNNRQYFFLGVSYYVSGDFRNALAAFETWSRLSSAYPGLVFYAATLAMLGEDGKAAEMTKRLMKRRPQFTMSTWRFPSIFKLAEHRRLILSGAEKAGIPTGTK